MINTMVDGVIDENIIISECSKFLPHVSHEGKISLKLLRRTAKNEAYELFWGDKKYFLKKALTKKSDIHNEFRILDFFNNHLKSFNNNEVISFIPETICYSEKHDFLIEKFFNAPILSSINDDLVSELIKISKAIYYLPVSYFGFLPEKKDDFNELISDSKSYFNEKKQFPNARDDWEVEINEMLSFLSEKANDIPFKPIIRLVHPDPSRDNFVYDGSSLKLIDWERSYKGSFSLFISRMLFLLSFNKESLKKVLSPSQSNRIINELSKLEGLHDLEIRVYYYTPFVLMDALCWYFDKWTWLKSLNDEKELLITINRYERAKKLFDNYDWSSWKRTKF